MLSLLSFPSGILNLNTHMESSSHSANGAHGSNSAAREKIGSPSMVHEGRWRAFNDKKSHRET